MILTDAGPLVAIVDRLDPEHARCLRTLDKIHKPMVTTWPALAEAMHLLGSRKGWTAQEKLWRLFRRGDLQVAHVTDALAHRAASLMQKYRDLPMDLADATIVAVAESLGQSRIFTLDTDFRVYRFHGRKSFETVP